MSKLTGSELREDASLFSLLVESVQDYAIYALDPAGRIVSWNRGAEQIKGYRSSDVLGRHFSLFFAPEDRAAGKPERLLRTAVERGRTRDEGWRVRHDGTRFWADVVLTALVAPDGTLAGFAKVTRDLTERRAAERALRMRERQLTDAQALARMGSWEWNLVTGELAWSDELCRILGLDPQSQPPATFEAQLERVHPDDRDRVRSEIERARLWGEDFEIEERVVRPDGSVRVLHSRGRAVRDDTGATTHLVGACIDVTEMRQAEEQAVQLAREQSAREAAEAEAARLRFLVQASEVLASSLDYEATLRNVAELAVPGIADGCAVDLVHEDGTLRRVAVAHADAVGPQSAQDLLSRFLPGRDAAGAVLRVAGTGEPEYHPDPADARHTPAAGGDARLAVLGGPGVRSVMLVPLVGRERPLGVLTLVQGESERRFGENDVWFARELGRHAGIAIENARLHRELASANEQLEARTREAEEANRAKSDFLAAMSHELRTPLNAIFGYAELMQLGLHGPVTEAQKEALERIKRSERALLVLINDVLNFAKLEAGRLELRVTDVAVGGVISELEKVVGPQLRAKGLRYACAPCDPELRARGERERIDQVLLNLLTNAIKYTGPGGTITLAVDADDDAVRLRVSDTGRGIPPDRLESVFDPFVQVERHPAGTGEGGVGLGLAISRDLAEAMGGTLTVQSTLGEGSTFTLSLRRSREGA